MKGGEPMIFSYIAATHSTQQYSQWWLQEIHWYIELHQVGDKYGIREVKLCYVVYPRDGRGRSTVNI